jgi:PAS domain S-box-containing protein
VASNPKPKRPAPLSDGERPRSKWALHEREYLRASFEQAPAGVCVFDEDGAALHANQVFLDIFGRPPEALGTRTDEDLEHPEDREFSDEIRRRMQAGDLDHCSFEKRYVRDDGTTIWTRVDVSAVPDEGGIGRFFVAHVRDVTKRKLAEEEFRTGADRFREAFRNAPVGMVLRGLRARTVWVNTSMEEMLGYRQDEYREVTLSDVAHPDDRSRLSNVLPALMAGSESISLGDIRLVHKDGRILHGQVHFSMVRDATGEPQSVISQVVDITARKRAEAEAHQRAEFDRVVTALATNFINLPLDRIDTGINSALQQIARFVGADRAAVVLFRDDDGDDVGIRHEWTAAGLEPIGIITGLHVWDFMSKSLAAGDTVYENDLVEDPPVRDDTRDYLLAQGVRAFVAVPFAGTRQAGLIGFSSTASTEWDVERLALLRIGAEMISNVLERGAADSLLRESSERLEQMADSVQTLFWVCRAEDRALVYASKGLDDLFGVATGDRGTSPERIRLDRMIHEDDISAVIDGFMRGQNEPTTYEYRIKIPSGEMRWLRTRCFPVPDPEGKAGHIAGVTDDISEEKATVTELAHHARFERLISELATDFINVPVEAIDQAIDRALQIVGEFVSVDIAFLLSLGSDHQSVQEVRAWTSDRGEPYRDQMAHLTLGAFPWTLERLRRGETIYMSDVTALPPEAEAERVAAAASNLRSVVAYPLIENGELIGALGFSSLGQAGHWSDATLAVVQVVATIFASVLERQRVDRELARRGEFERLIGHLAMDFVNQPEASLDAGLQGALRELAAFTGFHSVSIFQLDTDGLTISCTHAWASRPDPASFEALQRISLRDMQWSVERTPDRNAAHVIHIEELPVEAEAERQLLERIGVRVSVRVPMIGSSGIRGFLAFATATERPDLSDEIFSMLHIAAKLITNALDRRQAERAVVEHQAELAHALRLGTMGELAPWLAHELNQPLSAISSFARGCQRRLEAGDVNIAELTEVTKQMSDQALRAGEVVQSLRRYVRKHEPRREWHRMNDLVSSALSFLQSEATELAVEVARHLDGEPAWVQVDPIQIEQVVLNLVRNSFDAIQKANGGLRTVAVATRCAEGVVEVSVVDSGVGFASEEASELFEAFSSTKSAGLGLGLSLCRSIVGAHGGHIRAESTVGEGAAFVFTVPRTAAPREAAS